MQGSTPRMDRVLRAVAALALVATAAAWTGLVRADLVGPAAEAVDGEVILSLYDVVVAQDGALIVDKGGHRVRVVGAVDGLVVGDAASFGGRLGPTGELVAAWAEPHPGRRAKRWLGLAGLGWAAALGVGGLRWGPRGLVLRG